MTPGGADTVILTDRPIELMDLAVRILRRRWPQMVVEDMFNGMYTAFHQIPFGKLVELLVYKDPSVYNKSIDDPTDIDLFYFIRTSDALMVVHDPDSPTAPSLIAELKSVKFPGETHADLLAPQLHKPQ